MRLITLQQAKEQFNSDVKPLVINQYGEDDNDALNQAWNDYTDSLCQEGQLNPLQYHYCPSYDDDMPDCDKEFILQNLGLSEDDVNSIVELFDYL